MKILLVVLIAGIALAGTLKKAQTTQEVGQFNSAHQDSRGALFFYDASKEDESGVFNKVGNFINSVIGNDKKVSPTVQLMTKISNETDVLAVDTSNPDFNEISKLFEVTQSPYVIVFNEGAAIIKETPNDNTLKKIQAFNRINKETPAPNTANVTPVALSNQSPKPVQGNVSFTQVKPGQFERADVQPIPESWAHEEHPETVEDTHVLEKPAVVRAQPPRPNFPKPTPAKPVEPAKPEQPQPV